MALSSWHFSPKLWPCSHPPAIGLGQALARVLEFSAVLAAEDPKVCSLVCNTISLVHCCLVASKITTLTLGENGGRVLHVIGDPQTNTLSIQPKHARQGIRFVKLTAAARSSAHMYCRSWHTGSSAFFSRYKSVWRQIYDIVSRWCARACRWTQPCGCTMRVCHVDVPIPQRLHSNAPRTIRSTFRCDS